jgi:DNA-binding NtrC family response regulator
MRVREHVPLPDEAAQILAVVGCDGDDLLLSYIFQGTNWRLHIAHGIGEALGLLSAERFAVIITDERAPDGTWMSLLEGRSAESEWTPVIVASLHADERLWQEALNLGSFDVLAKPFDEWDVLWASFNAWLGWKNQFETEETEVCLTAAPASGV